MQPATKRANNGARAGKKGGKAGKKGRGGAALQEKKPQQVVQQEQEQEQEQMEEPVVEEAPAPSVGMEELLALRTTEQEKMAAKMRSQLAKHKEGARWCGRGRDISVSFFFPFS